MQNNRKKIAFSLTPVFLRELGTSNLLNQTRVNLSMGAFYTWTTATL